MTIRWTIRFGRLMGVALLLAVLLLVGARPTVVSAAPTTYYANQTADDAGTDPGDCAVVANTDCSLRAAVALANANPGSTVVVAPGTFTLTHADASDASSGLVLSASMTITGAGYAGTIIEANAAPNTATYRVLNIAGSNVTIGDVTIRHGVVTKKGSLNGYEGGGILTSGTGIKIARTAISGNTATGADDDVGGGGLAVNAGSTTLLDSTVSDNTATGTATNLLTLVYGGGAAIFAGTLTVEKSAFIDNTTHGIANGASVFSAGGAIYAQDTLSMTNSTVSGNSATGDNPRGGAIVNTGVSHLTYSTIAGNSVSESGTCGGLYTQNFELTLNNIIIANSTGADLCGTTDGDGNLIDDSSISNLTGSGNFQAAPLLAPLGNYGGLTNTMALLPGSPAISAGLAISGITTDQRGVTRDAFPDIGAFESQGYTLSAVSGSTPQSATIGLAFANPLAVTVTASDSREPVDGGIISFDAPSTGASATLSAVSATISGGKASVTATANANPGSYHVDASATGAALAVAFSLTNTLLPDTTSPVTSATATIPGPTSYAFGNWANQPVTVTLAASDATEATNDVESGVDATHYTLDDSGQQTYSVPFTVNANGDHILTFWSIDKASNSETVHTDHIKIDTMPPSVDYTGNQGTYTVDQTIDITCTATDQSELSGLASTTCADISGPAASFGAGEHTISATATDNAGNVGHGSVTFTVVVTFDSLRELTEQYASNPWVARELTTPLLVAEWYERMHSPRVASAAIDRYVRFVDLQAGRGLTEQEAATLIDLAHALQTNLD